MKGYIYKITSPSGRIYIGQTINLNGRLKNYRNNKTKNQPKLHNSILKYGWNAHVFETIDTCEETGIKNYILDSLEVYWIEQYDSFNNGLNCTIGGQGTIGHKHSEETKEVLRNKSTGVKLSEVAKKKVSEAGMGNKYNSGRILTEEHKKKLSMIGKNREFTDVTKAKISASKKGKPRKIGIGTKKVICLTTNVKCDSITQASIQTGVSSSSISKYLNGKMKANNVKGYRFEYIN
jgi:group I intron endonuclease